MMRSARPLVALVFPEHYLDAAGVLSRAFAAEPRTLAIAPTPREPSERAERLTGLFAAMIRTHGAAGEPVLGIYESGQLVAVAAVEGSMHPRATQTVLAGLATLPSLIRAVGWGGVIRSLKVVDAQSRNHPPQPHLYLNILGVDPPFQGRHFGVAILDYLRKMAAVRSDLAGVYLDTSTEANVTYYCRNGYEVIGEFYPLGVRSWCMFQRRPD